MQFRSHYTFEAKFCNVAKGNEKGGVEGLVKFSRRNFLVPMPRVETLEELNEMLAQKCLAHRERVLGGREDKRTVAQRVEEEKAVLLPLPAPYEWVIPKEAKVDKYQLVHVDGCRYSVPFGVGRVGQVHLECEKVKVYIEGKQVAVHQRSFTSDRWVLDPTHYLKLLERKVGAFDNAKPIRQWRQKWPVSYERLLEKLRQRDGEGAGTRAFLKVLALHQDHDAEEVEAAVELAWESGTYHIDGIKIFLKQLREDEARLPPALDAGKLRQGARITLGEPDTAKYDRLVGVER